MSEEPKTDTQRNCVHLFCQNMAIWLNNNDMLLEYQSFSKATRTVRKKWTKELVKELMWKPLLKAESGKKSTEEMNAVEPNEVYQAIAGHFAAEWGLQIPEWPTRWNAGGRINSTEEAGR